MDQTRILLVLVLINGCFESAGTNPTGQAFTNGNEYMANTTPVGLASSHHTSPVPGQTTHDGSFTNNQDNTGTTTYNKMSSKELTSWLTEIQSTFTNQVKRLPHTKPITQISTTKPTRTYTKSTTSTQITVEEENVTRVDSVLTKLLSTSTTSITDIATEVVTKQHMIDDIMTSSHVNTSTMGDYSPNGRVTMSTAGTPRSNTTESNIQTSTGDMFEELLALPDIIDKVDPGVHHGESTIDSIGFNNGSIQTSEKHHELLEKKKLEEMKDIQRKQLLELLHKINGTRRLSVRQLERLGLDMFTREELAEIVRSMNMKIDKDKENGKLNTENMGNVDEVISMDKLLVVVSTISGALILFIVIMCIIYCRKGKSEPNNESMKSDITLQLSKKSKSSMEDSNGKVNSDSFMGIPPNNDIWKELQELPKAGSTKDKDTQSCKF